MSKVMLSTNDNPFNPFKQFDEWLQFDIESSNKEGRNSTSCMLARFAATSIELSDEENNAIVDHAIDEIIKYDPLKIYVKVTDSE